MSIPIELICNQASLSIAVGGLTTDLVECAYMASVQSLWVPTLQRTLKPIIAWVRKLRQGENKWSTVQETISRRILWVVPIVNLKVRRRTLKGRGERKLRTALRFSTRKYSAHFNFLTRNAEGQYNTSHPKWNCNNNPGGTTVCLHNFIWLQKERCYFRSFANNRRDVL